MRRLDTRERKLAGRAVAWMQLAESGVDVICSRIPLHFIQATGWYDAPSSTKCAVRNMPRLI